MPFVYVLQEREFVKTKENIFKAGRTKDQYQRLQSYPNGSILLLLLYVVNEFEAEREVLKELGKHFKCRRDIGNEYFEGNIDDIIECIYKVVEMNNNKCFSQNTISRFLDTKKYQSPNYDTMYTDFTQWLKDNDIVKSYNKQTFINIAKEYVSFETKDVTSDSQEVFNEDTCKTMDILAVMIEFVEKTINNHDDLQAFVSVKDLYTQFEIWLKTMNYKCNVSFSSFTNHVLKMYNIKTKVAVVNEATTLCFDFSSIKKINEVKTNDGQITSSCLILRYFEYIYQKNKDVQVFNIIATEMFEGFKKWLELCNINNVSYNIYTFGAKRNEYMVDNDAMKVIKGKKCNVIQIDRDKLRAFLVKKGVIIDGMDSLFEGVV